MPPFEFLGCRGGRVTAIDAARSSRARSVVRFACRSASPASARQRRRVGLKPDLQPTGLSSRTKLTFTSLRDGGRVFPVALADAEVEPLELRRALEPGAAVLLLERELDRHVARHVAQGQLAGAAELVAAFGGEALGDVVRARKLLDGEQVVALDRVVALAVARVRPTPCRSSRRSGCRRGPADRT